MKGSIARRQNGGTTSRTAAEEAEEARLEVMRKADATMKTYHDAKLAKLRGELPSKNNFEDRGFSRFQLAVVGLTVLGFIAAPFLGKKIAKDKEFREKYIPDWYDYTVKRPTSEMTREEVHEQILQLQKEIRARAKAGEFSDEKLSKMRRYMDGLDTESNKDFNPDNDQHAWSPPSQFAKLHPGVADDEDIEDE